MKIVVRLKNGQVMRFVAENCTSLESARQLVAHSVNEVAVCMVLIEGGKK
jgi:hypothetical protein